MAAQPITFSDPVEISSEGSTVYGLKLVDNFLFFTGETTSSKLFEFDG